MLRKLITILMILTVGLSLVLVPGCQSKAQTGALVGGLGGAGVGAIIGNQSGHAGTGALIGGAVGAGAGYLIGHNQDK